MLTDATTPGSDDWYLVELANQLGRGFPRLQRLDSYRDGTFVVPVEADPAVKEAYKKFAQKARLTFADTICVQTVGRLNLRGFRTAAEDDTHGDKEATRIMRANRLQVQLLDVFDTKETHGAAFVVVGLDENRLPFATFRDGWTVTTMPNQLRPWESDAALIATFDPFNQQDVLTLLRPGYMRVAVKPAEQSTIPQDGTEWQAGLDWDWVGGPMALGFTERVPVVKFANRNSLGGFENHIDSIDRVTEDILQRLTITAMQAFRQRAVTPGDGKPLPEFYPDDHETNPGERINYDEIYKGGPAALWFLPEGAKIWESAPTDINGLILAEGKDLEHVAAVTGTPLYALSPDAQQSAEGAKLARDTIRTKVRDRQVRDGESAAMLMSILFEAYGDATRAEVEAIEAMWGPMEYTTKADVAEAARAAKQAGKSARFIDEYIFELTPEQMELEAMNRRDEQFQDSLMEVSANGDFGSGGNSARGTQALTDGASDPAPLGALGELRPVE